MLELQNEAALQELQGRKTEPGNANQRLTLRRILSLCHFLLGLAVVLGAPACRSSEHEPKPEPETTAERAGAPSSKSDGGQSEQAKQPQPRELIISASGPTISLSLLGRYRDPMFGAAGLPAISDDSQVVAYAVELEDGGRGHPNFRLVIRRVSDSRILHDLVILDPNKPWKPGDELTVRGRVAAANKRLAEKSWRELEPLIDQTTAGGEVADVGAAPALTFSNETTSATIRSGRVHIVRRGVIVAKPAVSKLITTNSTCAGAARLADVRVGRTVALIRFRFETVGCVRDSETQLVRLLRP